MLALARAYMANGLTPIPLEFRDKKPSIKWAEFQNRKPTDEELVKWFKKPCNIGIITGVPSGIVVIDLDGPAGIAEAEKLGLSSTVAVKTGKGKHLYYRHPGGIVQNNVRIAPGIDVRGDGGYVVAPTSVHASGAHYEWEVTHGEMGIYTPPAPWVEPLKPEQYNEKGWIAQAIRDMAPGNIDVTLFRICSRLRADGYTQEEALALLEPAALAAGATKDHLPAKIANVWGRYEAEKVRPTVASLSSFLEIEEAVEWLVPGIFAKKSIGLLAGLQETCKTWMAIDLALSVVSGTPWMGKFHTVKGRVLYIEQERFKGETQRRFKALLAGRGQKLSDTEGLNVLTGTHFKLNDQKSVNDLVDVLNSYHPDLVIVDSFSTFHSVNENNKSELQPVMETIKRLRTEAECAFVFVDHESKMAYGAEAEADPNAGTISGSQAKLAVVESILTVRKKGQGVSNIYPTKSTLGKAVEPFFVQVIDVTADQKAIRVEAQ